MSVPSANSHKQYDKAGCLQKLCGRGFPYLHHWKRRHCILSRGFLYVYENEDSKGNSKNSCVIDLKYFDHVIQASQKETKKATNVFIVTSQDKNLMDHHGRYTFSADTLTEMHDWMNRLKDTIDQIRNNNRASSTTRKNQNQIAKETPPTSPEQRRPSDTPDISAERLREEVQKALNEKTFSKLSREIATVPTAVVEKEEKSVPNVKVTSQKIFLEKADLTTLESMTKCRVKGPSGRRAPQFRKTVSKNLRAASSMTALQQNSSLEDGSRSGNRSSSILTVDRLSLADSSSVFDESSSILDQSREASVKFDDIELDLFFKRSFNCIEEEQQRQSEVVKHPKRSKSNSLFPFKKSLFRSPTFKFTHFSTTGVIASDHPDDLIVKQKRTCAIL